MLDRDILVVDESHLPAIGAAGMGVEVLTGQHIRRRRAAASSHGRWRGTVQRRWLQYRRHWSEVTGILPLSTLDDVAAGRAHEVPGSSTPPPLSVDLIPEPSR